MFIKLTLLFRRSLSLRVSVSAFAITGTMLTLLWMAFINSTSKGFRLRGKRNKINQKKKYIREKADKRKGDMIG